MMLCVSSVTYSILVNYDKVGPIFPGRGLRQGNPFVSLSLHHSDRRTVNSYQEISSTRRSTWS
jgi:hypothetical protein